jgi:hypothetical protein
VSLLFASSTSSKVDCGSAASLDNLQAWTLMCWVYRTTTLASGGIYSKGSFAGQTRNPNLQLRGNDGATPTITIDRATTDAVATGANASGDTLPLNAWAFLAATFDVTDGPRMFIGSLTAAVAEMGYASAPTVGSGAVGDNSSESAVIGNAASGDTQNKGFPGRIAFVAQYNRRMALGEIMSHQFRPTVASGCVLWTHLGFNGVSTQPDWSGNGNAGTVSVATQTVHVPLGPIFGFSQLAVPYVVASAGGFVPAWARGSNQLIGSGAYVS